MIAHREEKRCADVAGGSKKRDAILFLPIAIFDEGHVHTGRNKRPDLRDHALVFVAHHEMNGFDFCAHQGFQSVRNQGTTKHQDERLQESFVRAAQTRLPAVALAKAGALAGHQNHSFGDRSHVGAAGLRGRGRARLICRNAFSVPKGGRAAEEI